MTQPKDTTSDLKEDLWQAYLNEAKLHYPRISAADGLRNFIDNHIGDRIAGIENMSDEDPKKATLIAGAFMCIRSAGYVSAVVARTENQKAITLIIKESTYKKSYDVVKKISHPFISERICD